MDLSKVFKDTIVRYKNSMQEKFSDHNSTIEDIWVAFIVDKAERNICD